MAKQEKQELAVIDFEKFSIAQLPELQGKKEEIASVIKANPIVEIVDNGTYELAKKSRTAVRSLRTSLESEQKTVKKKIKEFVLDVVDGEYSNLVTDVKSAEKQRQDPIDVWEEKKEQERQEKARLEQERIDNIKNSISDFRRYWDDAIFKLTFDKIEDVREDYSVAVLEFDRSKLAEFEILFDDAVAFLDKLFENKEKTLTEQEQIRIDNLLIQEKNAENSRIQEWQRTWNANIDTLSFDDLKDVKSVLVKSKLADLKHYSNEYEEIYTSTEKRLHSQIELISKAEEQRIAQEKFLAEKKEFEEKQRKAKIEERQNHLKTLNVDLPSLLPILGISKHSLFVNALNNFTDDDYEVELKEFLEFIKPKEPVVAEREFESEPIASKTETIVGENLVQADYHEADVDVKGVVKTDSFVERMIPIVEKQNVEDLKEMQNEISSSKTHEFANYQEEVQYIEQIPTKSEVTWESIWEEYRDNIVNYDEIKTQEDVLDQYVKWLEKNYNVPTKKQ